MRKYWLNHKYLIIAMIFFSISIFLLFFIGCGKSYTKSGAYAVKLVCWDKSESVARAWHRQTGDPVRVAVHRMDNEVEHGQAQAFINNEWVWLQLIDDSAEPTNKRDFWATPLREPYKYYSLKQMHDIEVKDGYRQRIKKIMGGK